MLKSLDNRSSGSPMKLPSLRNHPPYSQLHLRNPSLMLQSLSCVLFQNPFRNLAVSIQTNLRMGKIRGSEGIGSRAGGARPTESIITLDRFSLKSYILITMRMMIVLVYQTIYEQWSWVPFPGTHRSCSEPFGGNVIAKPKLVQLLSVCADHTVRDKYEVW